MAPVPPRYDAIVYFYWQPIQCKPRIKPLCFIGTVPLDQWLWYSYSIRGGNVSKRLKVSIEIQRCGRLNRSILRDHLIYVIEQSSIHAGMIAAVASIVPKFSSTFSISRPDHLCTVSCDRGDYMETRLKETTIGWANSCSTLNVPGRAPYLKSWKWKSMGTRLWSTSPSLVQLVVIVTSWEQALAYIPVTQDDPKTWYGDSWYSFLLRQNDRRSKYTFGFLLSKETVVLRRWERSKHKFLVLSNELIKIELPPWKI